MIDFHCHLDLYPDPHAVADTCRAHGLYVLSVTTTPSAWTGTNALCKQGDRIRTALGLHPQLAHQRHAELPLFDELVSKTAYVGEIGLDGSPDFKPHWDSQLLVFNHVLTTCQRAGGRILSIHSRHASNDVLDCLERHSGAGTPVLHWFSGSRRDLDRAIAMGCWFSVGPAMLRGERGRVLAAQMPHDRVLTESDGPFAQMDGAPALPWDVEHAVNALGEIWAIEPHDVSKILSANLRGLVSPKHTRSTESERDQHNHGT